MAEYPGRNYSTTRLGFKIRVVNSQLLKSFNNPRVLNIARVEEFYYYAILLLQTCTFSIVFITYEIDFK